MALYVGSTEIITQFQYFFHKSIAGNSEECVSVTRAVNLYVNSLDVVDLGIVGEPVRQQTEDANSPVGGTDIDIGRTKAVYDLLHPREQLSILNAVVKINAYGRHSPLRTL